MPRSKIQSALGTVAAALMVTALLSFAGPPAQAQHRDDRDRRPPPPRHYRHPRPPPEPVYGYGAPTIVAAPPPLVYAPPEPGVALGFTFNLR